MYKGLQFKIILIFVIFTITLMAALGIVMVVGSFNYYNSEFSSTMDLAFNSEGELVKELNSAVSSSDYITRIKEILRAYSGSLGIDNYRNYYVLDANGGFLDGSDSSLGASLEITPNILTAMSGTVGKANNNQTGYSDYAYYIGDENASCIVYIKDSNDDAKEFTSMIFRVLVETLVAGMAVAIALSFFLSKAITTPIKELTEVSQKISQGNYDEDANVKVDDEIGTLSTTINNMKEEIKN
ncbi:MAG: cell wall metabolism sensor histidine kinase WalK, partial [Clostridia bacterium]|nr:cell wall metabolism sensor histidine kinase WalK [Clostridia bacterium]